MVGEWSLPCPQGVVSVLLDFSFVLLSSLFDLLSLRSSSELSSEKASSAAADEIGAAARLLLASALSWASTAAGEPGGGASGAGSMVAMGVGPKSGTFALATPVVLGPKFVGVADSGAPVEGGAKVVIAGVPVAWAPGGDAAGVA